MEISGAAYCVRKGRGFDEGFDTKAEQIMDILALKLPLTYTILSRRRSEVMTP